MAYTVTQQNAEQAKTVATATGISLPTILQLLQEFGPIVLTIIMRLFPNLFPPAPAPTPVPPVPTP